MANKRIVAKRDKIFEECRKLMAEGGKRSRSEDFLSEAKQHQGIYGRRNKRKMGAGRDNRIDESEF